jgi:hypothetical protein
MAAPREHDARNAAERARLHALVARLGDAELQRPMPGGWTVAAVLAHLAFWDERARLLFAAWQREGTAARAYDPAAVDWINDAAKPLCLALPPRRAAELALAAAEAADRVVAGLPDALLAANAAAGTPVSPSRWDHRKEHLDEIEAALR